MKKYTYQGFSWEGPNVETIEDILKSDIDNVGDNVYNNDGLYVILSDFCLLDDTVLGLPRSYVKCFIDIMSMVEDEIFLAKQRDDNDSAMVKTCLRCNKIIPYLEWK